MTFDHALADFTEAIRLNPAEADAYAKRGHIYGKQGRYAEAIADFSEVIRLDPNNVTVYIGRGVQVR